MHTRAGSRQEELCGKAPGKAVGDTRAGVSAADGQEAQATEGVDAQSGRLPATLPKRRLRLHSRGFAAPAGALSSQPAEPASAQPHVLHGSQASAASAARTKEGSLDGTPQPRPSESSCGAAEAARGRLEQQHVATSSKSLHAREPSPPPAGIFICEFKCGFSGTYQQVAMHELTHAKPPFPARRVPPNPVGVSSPPPPTQPGETPACFQCEFKCGFTGAYDEVLGHEKTCVCRPPDVADCMPPRNAADFTPALLSKPAPFGRAGAAETRDGDGEDDSATGVGPDAMGTFAGDCTEDLMSEMEECFLSSRSPRDRMRDVGLVAFADDGAPAVESQDAAAADEQASFDASLGRLIDRFKGRSDDALAPQGAAAERDAHRAAAVTAASLLDRHARSAASARLTQGLRQASPVAASPKLEAEIPEEPAAVGEQREVRKSSDQAPVMVKVVEKKLHAAARGDGASPRAAAGSDKLATERRSVASGSAATRGTGMGAIPGETMTVASKKVEAALSLSYASRVSAQGGGDGEVHEGASFMGFLADLKAGNRKGVPDAEDDSVRTLEKLRQLKQDASDAAPAPLSSSPSLVERRAPQREESEAVFQDVLNYQALNRNSNRRLGRMGQLDYLLEELCRATGFGYAEVWLRHRKAAGAQSWSEGRMSSDPARSSMDAVRNFINRRVNVLSRRSSQDLRQSVEASRRNLSSTQSRAARPLGGSSQSRPWHELANIDIGNIAEEDDENDADDTDDVRMRARRQFADTPLLARCWPWGGHEGMRHVSASLGLSHAAPSPASPEHGLDLSSRSRPTVEVLVLSSADERVCTRCRSTPIYARTTLFGPARQRVGVATCAVRPHAQDQLVS